MLKFVLGKKHVSRRLKTADNDGRNVLVDSVPGGSGGFRDARDNPDLHEESEGFQTLEKLLLEVNIPVMMMEKGLSGIMAVLLMDAVRG